MKEKEDKKEKSAKHKALKGKYEGSKLDKYLDKKMGYKEGSKKDEEMDKKVKKMC